MSSTGDWEITTTDFASDEDVTWTAKVVEVVQGQEAWNAIRRANMFNDEPMQGLEYLLLRLEVSVIDAQNDAMLDLWSVANQFSTRSQGRGSDRESIVFDNLLDDMGLLYEGGTVDGWIAFMVSAGDEAPLLVKEFDDGSRLYWALR